MAERWDEGGCATELGHDVFLFMFIFIYFYVCLFCCFGEGACFIEREVVVGGGFLAPRVPHVAHRLELVAQHTLRLAWRMATVGGLSGVWGLGTGMPLGLQIEQSHTSASAADPL